MKYFLDCEFIEDGRTIDLLSIALVCQDGRELYQQNGEAHFSRANEWVRKNVFPRLLHFDAPGLRMINAENSPWRTRAKIRDEILTFCDPVQYRKPEFWGYYSAYDWVALCQLFGPMIALPKGYPMFCNDLIQWCKMVGNPDLPKLGKGEHGALQDARWNKSTWEFLFKTSVAFHS
jgi:hypothetical protein